MYNILFALFVIQILLINSDYSKAYLKLFQIRELYSVCISSSVVDSPEYKHCIQLLKFQSKEEILDLLQKSVDLINEHHCSQKAKSEEKFFLDNKNPEVEVDESNHLSIISNNIYNHLKNIDTSNWSTQKTDKDDEIDVPENLNRQQLKEVFILLIITRFKFICT